jgi:His-Xaa-Ser system protein HxsD
LTSSIGVSDHDFSIAVESFKKDVLDYHLRAKIKAETAPVRNLILGLAFSKTGLQDRE